MLTPAIEALDRLALEEDLGRGDVTSEAIFLASDASSGTIVAKEPLVVAGIAMARGGVRARRSADRASWRGAATAARVAQGRRGRPASQGARAALLAGGAHRAQLLQRLSGVATLTRRFVDARRRARGRAIVDTRKTTPGLRALEKAAVRRRRRRQPSRRSRRRASSSRTTTSRRAAAVRAAVERGARAGAALAAHRGRGHAAGAARRGARRPAPRSCCSTTCRRRRSSAAVRAHRAAARVVEVSGGITCDTVRAYRARPAPTDLGRRAHALGARGRSLARDVTRGLRRAAAVAPARGRVRLGRGDRGGARASRARRWASGRECSSGAAFPVTAAPRRGYRLDRRARRAVSGRRPARALTPSGSVARGVTLARVGSTSDEAAALGARRGAGATRRGRRRRRAAAGRGRLGRGWHSPPGASFTSRSCCGRRCRPRVPPLTLAAGVAVAEALVAFGVDAGAEVAERRAARRQEGRRHPDRDERRLNRVHHLVVGIGVNLNTRAFPTSWRHRDVAGVGARRGGRARRFRGGVVRAARSVGRRLRRRRRGGGRGRVEAACTLLRAARARHRRARIRRRRGRGSRRRRRAAPAARRRTGLSRRRRRSHAVAATSSSGSSDRPPTR